jgi:hypothetical protein
MSQCILDIIKPVLSECSIFLKHTGREGNAQRGRIRGRWAGRGAGREKKRHKEIKINTSLLNPGLL